MKRREIAIALFVLSIFLSGCGGLTLRKTSFLPLSEDVPALEIQTGPDYYTRDNLYDLIDGEAEFFFSYNFRSAHAAEYIGQVKPQEKIYAYIFDMGRHLNAFGIYSSFISPEGEFYKLGAEGYFFENSLYFYKGKYFVQVFSHSPSKELAESIKDVGAEIEKNIKGKTEAPSKLRILPKEDLIAHSEMYIPEGVLGYSPLRNGITGKYVIGGHEVTAFICSYWEWSAGDAFAKLIKQLGGEPFTSEEIKGKLFAKELEGSGVLVFLKKGRTILGVKGVEKKEEALPLLKKIIDKL